jgi:hypothetical protein
MKWFDKWFARQCEKAWNAARIEKTSERPISVKHTTYIEDEPILSFRIYSAQNGKILEFSKYDRIKDRTDRSIYIIGKDEDVAEKVSKCLGLELMR